MRSKTSGVSSTPFFDRPYDFFFGIVFFSGIVIITRLLEQSFIHAAHCHGMDHEFATLFALHRHDLEEIPARSGPR